MEWRSAFKVSLKGLGTHQVRAGLSMLGIIFGVASVVAALAVSEGAQGEMLKQLAALGAHNIIVKESVDWRAGGQEARDLRKRQRLRSEGLTVAEAAQAAATTERIRDFAPVRKVRAAVRLGEQAVNAEVVGAPPSFLPVMDFQLREGRWINAEDEAAARRVCVIEDDLRREYSSFASPLGRQWVVDHEPYLVVGVLRSKEVSEEKYSVVDVKQLNRRVYIPLAAALLRTTREPLSGEVSEVIFRCREAEDVRPAAELLDRFYEAAHRMEGVASKERDYKVTVALDQLKQIEEAQRIFNIVMYCAAGISLVVGGIGIMNIMLANVSERRREVGIRRAVGATKLDVLQQFILESLLICLVGGLLGCGLGVGFAHLVAYYTQWKVVLALWGMGAALVVSLLDGMVFGTYPAWKAAQLDPIEALQYE